MASAISVKLEGLDPFLRNLRKVKEPKRRARLLTQVLNAGQAPTRNAMRKQIRSQNAIGKGHLLKSITSTVRAYSSGVVVMIVGAKAKKLADGANPGNYFHLVDLGTRSHSQVSRPMWINGQWRMIPGTSTHRGATAKPIREPALQSINSERIASKMLAKAEKVWAKEMARAG